MDTSEHKILRSLIDNYGWSNFLSLLATLAYEDSQSSECERANRAGLCTVLLDRRDRETSELCGALRMLSEHYQFDYLENTDVLSTARRLG